MDYKLVSEFSKPHFEHQVQSWLDKGWKLVGGVSVTYHPSIEDYYGKPGIIYAQSLSFEEVAEPGEAIL